MAVVLGYVVCADAAEASRLADALVQEKLAACVNIVPAVQSVFFDNGRLEKPAEVLLLCKTLSVKMNAVEKRVKALHSYSVPCICFYQAAHVNAEYEQWVHNALAAD